MREFDRYQGKGVPDGKVSLALRLTFRAADRTLTDGEIQTAMDAIVARSSPNTAPSSARAIVPVAMRAILIASALAVRAQHCSRGRMSHLPSTERMVKSAVARTVDLDPIDRLEDKVKLLVGLVTQLRAEQARSAEENARLTEELEELRARVTDLDGTASELAALRDERELVRARVSDMLRQLDHLNA